VRRLGADYLIPKGVSFMRLRALVFLAALLASAGVAHAKSPVQLAPTTDNNLDTILMVNKTVGTEQWVLVLDAEAGVLTGNVFDLSGKPPTFFYCDVAFSPDLWSDASQISAETLTFTCQVAGGCTALDCSSDWHSVGADITLPGSFFLP
jgi:hypothetical protein